MSTVIVEYVLKNAFTELNKASLSANNGNFGQIYCYNLTFPVDINDNVVTGLTKEEAEKFEDELGLMRGDLQFKSKYAKDQRFAFKKSAATVLNLEQVYDRLAYQCLKANSTTKNKLVAMSEKDKTSDTVLLVRDETQENKDILVRQDIKKKAYKAEASLSLSDKRNILLLIGERGTETLASEKVEQKINALLDSEPRFFLELVEKAKDSVKVTIEEMLAHSILKRNGENGRKIMISDTDDVIGVGVEEASNWFKDVNNAKEVIRLKAKLDNIKAKK